MFLRLLSGLLIFMGVAENLLAEGEHHYEKEVAAMLSKSVPAPGGILLVGSSTLRLWKTAAEDLAPMPVTNRAFGGSQTPDQLHFFDRIVPDSQAKIVVWYCGSNDVNARRPTEEILKNTEEWIERTRAALPNALIVLVGVVRAPQKRRENLLPTVDELNDRVAKLAESLPGVTYVNLNPAVENETGKAEASCFVEDQLHFSVEGHQRMTSVLRPVLQKLWESNEKPSKSIQ